jgi:hypothetical protein
LGATGFKVRDYLRDVVQKLCVLALENYLGRRQACFSHITVSLFKLRHSPTPSR